MLVLAHSTRCVCAPLAASAFQRELRRCPDTSVSQLAVGDRNFALDALQLLLARAASLDVFSLASMMASTGVVDAADEEAGYAGHLADVAAAWRILFQAGDVGFGHLLVNLLREQQRDIDVDAFADQLAGIAGMPSAVPGILIITFSRPTAFHSRRASSIVPLVSRAR